MCNCTAVYLQRVRVVVVQLLGVCRSFIIDDPHVPGSFRVDVHPMSGAGNVNDFVSNTIDEV